MLRVHKTELMRGTLRAQTCLGYVLLLNRMLQPYYIPTSEAFPKIWYIKHNL